MVPAAQTAEVVAVGRTAVAVGGDVVEVDPADRLAAVGVPAAAVALLAEPPLRRRRPVPVDRGR
jgi:hypothetical protein